MSREQFIDPRLKSATLRMVAQANAILEEYTARGLTMTLRQLHYQFVSRGLFPNTKQSYKKLGNAMSQGRLAGLVDWRMMEDRARALDSRQRWDNPSDIIKASADQYREDLWRDQQWRPEVWIEKDALAGVIEGVCGELRVDFFACRGYVSQSAQYDASKRFLRYIANGQEPIVFHLGDHDPSGLDMTRENRAKFDLLTGETVEVRRLALNFDQVQQYRPPPNFAKMKDSRAAGYVKEFGRESWELDALDPQVISDLVRDAIEPLINRRLWKKHLKPETANRKLLRKASDRWTDVVKFLRRG